ncbi:MAG TPA: RDD family protein [Nitrospiria bacterium]
MTRPKTVPIVLAVIVSLSAVVVFLFLLHRIPLPKLPPRAFNLQTAGLGDRLYLFLVQIDPSATPWLMKTVEGGRVRSETEIKPFQSVIAFSDKLWFFSSGVYRVFDGTEWQRYDAPWVGDDPVAAAAPAQLWLLSRVGKDYSLTSYLNNVWDRPLPVKMDSNDRERLCAERCPSSLFVFKGKLYHFWLKDGTLYQWTFDGEHFSPVESLGRMSHFEAMADPNRLLIWYFPAAVATAQTATGIGVRIFDGNAWREAEGMKPPSPVGPPEISPVLFQGRPHLVINTGVQIMDQVWEEGGHARSTILAGGDLGPSVIRYQAVVILLMFVTAAAAAAVLSAVLDRWKPARAGREEASSDSSVRYASLWRRFAAKAVDTAIVLVPIGAIVWSRLNPADLIFPGSLAHFLAAGGRGWMIAPLLLFTYHSLAEGFWGQTYGKRLCRIAVVDRSLQPCTLLQSVIRNLLRLADGIGLYGVGFVSISATDRWQRLGDLAGQTVVIQKKI